MLVRRSASGLMDRALDQAAQKQIAEVLASFLSRDVKFHALRTRQAGRRAFISIDVLVPERGQSWRVTTWPRKSRRRCAKWCRTRPCSPTWSPLKIHAPSPTRHSSADRREICETRRSGAAPQAAACRVQPRRECLASRTRGGPSGRRAGAQPPGTASRNPGAPRSLRIPADIAGFEPERADEVQTAAGRRWRCSACCRSPTGSACTRTRAQLPQERGLAWWLVLSLGAALPPRRSLRG
jgi:hypothetical protein